MIYSFSISIFGCKSEESPTDSNGTDTPKGWNIVWSDEFKYTGLPDSTKWTYDVGGHGWGNGEEQYYTSKRLKNARVEDDLLIIEAHKESMQGNDYTSCRLVSTGAGNWTYGRFEVRARLPHGVGTWPAIWMLPTVWNYGNGGWPDNGEIDIMEHVGYNPGVVHGSIHCKSYYHSIGTQKTGTIPVPDAQNAYHVYALEWNADTISVFVDSNKYFTFVNEKLGWEKWPFDKDFHFILNIAVGGGWGGQQGIDDNIFPQQMEVDYVRVYRKVE